MRECKRCEILEKQLKGHRAEMNEAADRAAYDHERRGR